MEAQNALPVVNTDPVELGVNEGNRATVLGRFKADADYARRFAEAFPGEADPVNLDNIAKAVASFSRTLLSYRAPFDRFEAGDATALSESAKRGLALFESERLECNQCHGGFNFTDSTRISGSEAPVFHNTGLYNIAGLNGLDNYPAGNQGIYEFTGASGDKGRMRAPSLRNIALTAPYNHDGSTATLGEVIDHYARGGRLVTSPLDRAGDGQYNSLKDGELHGFTLTAQEKADLMAFLDSLTDTAFTTDPRLSNPFPP
jgi:cytochrome c peroxidase